MIGVVTPRDWECGGFPGADVWASPPRSGSVSLLWGNVVTPPMIEG